METPSFLARLIGANYRTTISGGLTRLLSSIVTGSLTFPSDFHNVKQVLLFACVVLSTFFGLQFAVQTKSKEVTGGNTEQDSEGNVAKPQHETPPPPEAAIPSSKPPPTDPGNNRSKRITP